MAKAKKSSAKLAEPQSAAEAPSDTRTLAEILEASAIRILRETRAADVVDYYVEVSRSRYRGVQVPAGASDAEKAELIKAAVL